MLFSTILFYALFIGDRWVCDLVSDGNFRVKEIRNYIDDLFLPHQAAQTRWIKYIPIKVNIFAWRARQDCLPTRVNLIRRGITIESSLCPVCSVCEEDVCHIFFRCDLAQLVLRRICRWWGLDPHDWSSFQEWQSWILSIQFSSKKKRHEMILTLVCVNGEDCGFGDAGKNRENTWENGRIRMKLEKNS
ncbi:RNA-directed DNA polymerase, eukaryota [Tanacetum coccineum]